jgi:hypothetical protein
VNDEDITRGRIAAVTAQVTRTREANKILRRAVVSLVSEKLALEDVIARQSAYILEMRKSAGLAPHDWEPARPGIEDVD